MVLYAQSLAKSNLHKGDIDWRMGGVRIYTQTNIVGQQPDIGSDMGLYACLNSFSLCNSVTMLQQLCLGDAVQHWKFGGHNSIVGICYMLRTSPSFISRQRHHHVSPYSVSCTLFDPSVPDRQHLLLSQWRHKHRRSVRPWRAHHTMLRITFCLPYKWTLRFRNK
jgi:hypothetical protein